MSTCPECGLPKSTHIQNWVDGFFDELPHLPRSLDNLGSLLERGLERLLILLGLVRYTFDFKKEEIPMRTRVFMEAAGREGAQFEALKSRFGYVNRFKMHWNGKTIRFEGLPAAEFLDPWRSRIDDKNWVKNKFSEFGFPFLSGRNFWFFDQREAVRYGKLIEFPLVVKPRSGTFARHITTNIKNETELVSAIRKAANYSPQFLIERFLDAPVIRITIIDFDKVFAVRRVAPFVTGDGQNTIHELIETKNANPNRGSPDESEFTIYKISVDEDLKKTIASQGYSLNSIPPKGAHLVLHKDPFIRLGAELENVTEQMHPENKKLFMDLARVFGLHLVGLDILIPDIGRSWREQDCGILELNSLPCIEIHHEPTIGQAQNVGGAIFEMVKKYY